MKNESMGIAQAKMALQKVHAEVTKGGKTLLEAIEASPFKKKPKYYYWKAKAEGKPKSSVKVVTYDAAKVKTKRAAKTKMIEGDLFFAMGSPDMVARFYKSLKE